MFLNSQKTCYIYHTNTVSLSTMLRRSGTGHMMNLHCLG